MSSLKQGNQWQSEDFVMRKRQLLNFSSYGCFPYVQNYVCLAGKLKPYIDSELDIKVYLLELKTSSPTLLKSNMHVCCLRRFACMCVCACMFVCVCAYVCIHVCVYVCVYVVVYVYVCVLLCDRTSPGEMQHTHMSTPDGIPQQTEVLIPPLSNLMNHLSLLEWLTGTWVRGYRWEQK